MDPELHIASLVVLTIPRRLSEVVEAIESVAGARVHATTPAGKSVVTLEAACADEMANLVSGIQSLDGVLSATLVYQCSDSLAAMNEEIRDVDAKAGIR